MKALKIFSLLIAVVLLATMALSFPTTAEDLPSVYVTKINQRIDYGDGIVFTKHFNNSNTIKSSEGNFRWTKQIVCKPTDKPNVYELVSDTVGNLMNGTNGTADESLTIPEGGFIYAAHIDDRDPNSDAFHNSKDNQNKIANLKAGQKVTVVGIDVANGTIQADAVIYIGELSDESSSSSSEASAPSSSSSAPASSSSTAPSSTSSAASSASSNQPQTGDDGIAWLAAAALISLAGASALSLRTRRRTR